MNIHEQIENVKAAILKEPSRMVRQQMQRKLRDLEFKLKKG